jgi:hypothetical protein
MKKIFLVIVVLTFFSCKKEKSIEAQKPNILWIFLEDTAPLLSSYGETLINTPNIDSLAKEGVLYTNVIMPAPVCSASRSSIITGVMATSFGAQNHHSSRTKESAIHLPDGLETIPEVFKQHGYFTFNNGKDDYNFVYDRLELYSQDYKVHPLYGKTGARLDLTKLKDKQPFFGQIQMYGGVEVDIYFHHFNETIFRKLIYDNKGVYNTYIIMPANLENVNGVLNHLSNDSVYILDQSSKEVSKYPSIIQNFKQDVFNGLSQANHLLTKYKRLILLDKKKKQPKQLLEGFQLFCDKHNYDNAVVDTIENLDISKGDVFIIPDDRNLIKVIKKIQEKQFKLANDIGIISYNDTLLKEIVEGGITTISTDFNKMGETLAKMIMNKESLQVHNPSKLIIRKSL